MSIVWTQDGAVLVFDAEVGTASGTTEDQARRRIECRRQFKRAREFGEARDMILAHSVEAFR